MGKQLSISLSNHLELDQLKLILKEFFPTLAFLNYDDLSKTEHYPSGDQGVIYLYENTELIGFKYLLAIALPEQLEISNTIEIKIGRAISLKNNAKALVAGDFYDENLFPHSWILIDKEKYFEADLIEDKRNEIDRVEVIRELKVDVSP